MNRAIKKSFEKKPYVNYTTLHLRYNYSMKKLIASRVYRMLSFVLWILGAILIVYAIYQPPNLFLSILGISVHRS